MVKKTSKSKNFHLISPQEQLRYDFFKSYDTNLSLSKIQENNVINPINRSTYVSFNNFNSSFKVLSGNAWENLLLRSNNKKAS